MEEQPQGVPTRPVVACLRCREQKLKCGRELPSCERCRKQYATCIYPAPPDRKRLAAEKSNRAKATQANSEKQAHRSESSSTESNTAKRRHLSQDITGPFDCLAQPTAAELPSTEIGLLLGEVYYKHIYNATLMFHKTVGFQVYMLNKTPEYLQRAMFAHAALFLQEVDPQHQKYIKTYPMQTLYDRSWAWAHAASVEVLSHVDEPSVLKIQALQVLQLYYWARGEIVRAKIHTSLAYRLSQILGYDKLYENGDPTLINPSLKFDREIRRRSFWASWATMCFQSEEIARVHESATGLPLPAKFGPGGSIQGVDLTHGQKMTRAWKLHKDSVSDDGGTRCLLAELMKLLGIWYVSKRSGVQQDFEFDKHRAKLRALVLELRNRSTLRGMEELRLIDASLQQVEPSVHFPVAEILAKANSYDESPELLVSVCSVYHLSRIFVEASQNQDILDCTSHAFRRKQGFQRSSERLLVLEQALNFTELLEQVIANGLDITRLWHVTGYTAFIVARIILFYRAHPQSDESITNSPQAPGLDSNEMKTCQVVLEILSTYWKPLKSLVANLNVTIEFARSNSTGLNAMLTFPWDYINFLSDGEPISNEGPSAKSPQAFLDQEEPLQENVLVHTEVPQELGAGFLPVGNPGSSGFEGHAIETEWWGHGMYRG